MLNLLSEEQIDDWRQATKYRVEARTTSGLRKEKGIFVDKKDAEDYMGAYEASEDYDYWHETLWLVEVSPHGIEKDL